MNEDTDRCPATNRNGDPCGHPAGWGTDSNSGPCKFHGGASDGPPEGNANSETHGLTSDPQKYYERQSAEEQARIDAWAESWADRASYGAPGFDSLLHETAITLHQIHSADAYIAENGIIVEDIIGATEDGRPITTTDENPAFLLKSRAMKDVIRTLKEFGCLDDPDSAQAAATATLSEVLNSENP